MNQRLLELRSSLRTKQEQTTAYPHTRQPAPGRLAPARGQPCHIHQASAKGIGKGIGMAAAVYRLFRSKAFEPEAISTMTRAHAEACRVLGLNDRNYGEAAAVAEKVIEFAQRGERDPTRLRESAGGAARLARGDQRLSEPVRVWRNGRPDYTPSCGRDRQRRTQRPSPCRSCRYPRRSNNRSGAAGRH